MIQGERGKTFTVAIECLVRKGRRPAWLTPSAGRGGGKVAIAIHAQIPNTEDNIQTICLAPSTAR